MDHTNQRRATWDYLNILDIHGQGKTIPNLAFGYAIAGTNSRRAILI